VSRVHLIQALRLGCAALLLSVESATGAGIDYGPDFFQQFPLYRPVEGLSGQVRVLSPPLLDVVFRRALDEFSKFYPQLDVALNETAADRADVPKAFVAGESSFIGALTPLTAQQLADFEKRFGYRPELLKFAVASIGIFVFKDNPVQGLTLQQIDSIFSAARNRGGREALKWGDVGLSGEWVGREIITFGYRGPIGFYDWFRESALLGGQAKGTMRDELSDTSAIQGAGVEPGGIAYANLLFATDRTRFVPVAGEDGKFHLPLHRDCVSQAYPMCRFMYVFVNAGAKSKLSAAERQFIAFLLSREGQTAVADGAQYPVTPELSRQQIEQINRWAVGAEDQRAAKSKAR
jgi:phosphate transport system substrate-binding protein